MFVRHVGVPTLFSCKKFILFREICIAADHMSKNDLYQKGLSIDTVIFIFTPSVRLFIQLRNSCF